jgi:hypothetical protein
MGTSLSEGVDSDPLLVLILEELVSAPINSEPNLAVHIWQRGYSEGERRDRELAFSLWDLLVVDVDIETLLSVAASVSTNYQDTLVVDLARAETLSGAELGKCWGLV